MIFFLCRNIYSGMSIKFVLLMRGHNFSCTNLGMGLHALL